MRPLTRDTLPPTVLLWLTVAFPLALASGADFQLAQTLYQWQGERWALRNHWLLEDVLHRGARTLMLLSLLLLAACWLWKLWRGESGPRRTALGYLILSAFVSVLLVSTFKQLSGVACPWSLQGFGGTLLPGGSYLPRGSGRCFPSGHASAGYAWFGLYFVAAARRPAQRHRALIVVALTGLCFGLTQQLRGAHFLSHDIATAWICWCCAWALSPYLNRTRQ